MQFEHLILLHVPDSLTYGSPHPGFGQRRINASVIASSTWCTDLSLNSLSVTSAHVFGRWSRFPQLRQLMIRQSGR